MLIEFRVENHRSLRDEQALTMVAGRVGDADDPRLRKIDAYSESLLPVAVIYGANASGKSNVLSALGFMATAVIASHRFWHPNAGIPRIPFAWDSGKDFPTSLEVIFVAENIRYAYGFSLNDVRIEEEWLHAWPVGRKQLWFERQGDHYKFGEHLKGPNDTIKEVTRPDALFLSAAAQHKHAQLATVYNWFDRILWTSVGGQIETLKPTLFGTDRFSPSSSMRDQTLQLLKAADTGIVDLRIAKDELDGLGQRRQIQFRHQADDDDSWLDLQDESQGTKTLLNLSSPVIHVLSVGGILLLDELESSLHPLLGQTIVELFNDRISNHHNAQLIFTTHDTNLLGTTLGDSTLRRDQIWLTEKDKAGSTTLYPLTDFKPRKTENLERGYLQGRYGAIPFVGDLTRITE